MEKRNYLLTTEENLRLIRMRYALLCRTVRNTPATSIINSRITTPIMTKCGIVHT